MKHIQRASVAFSLFAAFCGLAVAQEKIKIGFITDMASNYADADGKNGALAIQMAIDDFGGKVLGKPIELLTADHQQKADVAVSKARDWVDNQGLTMLVGAPIRASRSRWPSLLRTKSACISSTVRVLHC